jgi:predicted nucleic acid-binding protein
VRLVVADTGPLHYLVLIGHIDLIPASFETVLVPSEVQDELSRAEAPPEVRSWIANPPAWVTVVPAPAATTDPLLLRLDRGERAAIVLAISLKIDAIIMDDRAGVTAAKAKGFAVVGTLGILDAAARQGKIDLAQALDRLRKTTFRRKDELFDAVLKKHREEGGAVGGGSD